MNMSYVAIPKQVGGARLLSIAEPGQFGVFFVEDRVHSEMANTESAPVEILQRGRRDGCHRERARGTGPENLSELRRFFSGKRQLG